MTFTPVICTCLRGQQKYARTKEDNLFIPKRAGPNSAPTFPGGSPGPSPAEQPGTTVKPSLARAYLSPGAAALFTYPHAPRRLPCAPVAAGGPLVFTGAAASASVPRRVRETQKCNTADLDAIKGLDLGEMMHCGQRKRRRKRQTVELVSPRNVS